MLNSLTCALADMGAIQFGKFKLKSGIISPIYLDLRILVSYPSVLREAARALAHTLAALTFDRIAAIPYAALPIGTAVALEMDRPLIYPRRERKEYGTARAIEGQFHSGETAVIIDDVVTTGASKVEAIEPLVAAGLIVRDIVVLVDREQGGASELAGRGFRVQAILKMSEMLQVLNEEKRIPAEQYREVLEFLSSSR